MPVLDAQWIERRLGVARTTKQQERLADGEFLCCRPVYVGRNILLCGRKDSVFPFQCMVGPDWPCMLITYSIITVPSVIFFILVASQINWVALLLGLVTFSLTILSFSLTACSDPGIVYRKVVDEEAGAAAAGPATGAAAGPGHVALPPATGGSSNSSSSEAAPLAGGATALPAGESSGSTSEAAAEAGASSSSSDNHNHNGSSSVGMTVSGGFAATAEPPTVVHATSRSGAPVDPNARIPCHRCEMSRPVGASHCYDCEVCVKGLDHHCPWTGKCIGRKNLCYFYAFLVSLTIHILYVGVATGMNAISTGFKLHGGGSGGGSGAV